MREMPVADAIWGFGQGQPEWGLFVYARPERQRVIQGVAESDIDVPVAAGVVGRRQVVDREDEVVGHRLLVRTLGTVHPANVASDVVAEGREQLAERAVEVEAIAAPTGPGDPGERFLGRAAVVLTGVDPYRLVGNALHMRMMQLVKPIN